MFKPSSAKEASIEIDHSEGDEYTGVTSTLFYNQISIWSSLSNSRF